VKPYSGYAGWLTGLFIGGRMKTGMYVDDYAALGHRRLSIIDRAGGQQPMAAANGEVQIIFNGEIFGAC